jgi:hypothetical protein
MSITCAQFEALIEMTVKKTISWDLTPCSLLEFTDVSEAVRPPLWSSGQSSWLQIQVWFPVLPDFFWEVVGLERGPLSLVKITEELLQGNSGSGLENRN